MYLCEECGKMHEDDAVVCLPLRTLTKLALVNPAADDIVKATGRIIAGMPVYYSMAMPVGLIMPFDEGVAAADLPPQIEITEESNAANSNCQP